jgi:hypothetical protein
MQLGIIVLDAVDGPWPDDDTAAIVACGECVAVNPGLEDDGLRADVLAMALAVTWFMNSREAGRAEDIRAAGGLVLISQDTCQPGHDQDQRPGQGPSKRSLMAGVTEGAEVQAGAGEEAF